MTTTSSTPPAKKSGKEHSITPMHEVRRKIANGWYDLTGCKHYEDRTDWRELLCPTCKENNRDRPTG